MTTRLAGEGTRFLPFNRGSHPGGIGCGKGNPPHPSGYPTGYFWQEVLGRERFLDILGSYVFVESREEKVEDEKGARTVKREGVVFPRYHQLDAVNKLVEQARSDGPGRNYLVQHSAGSGKTNSISWLSHRLSSLHTAADDRKVFDCVVVMTDRRVLGCSSCRTRSARSSMHRRVSCKPIDEDSQQLAKALTDDTKIVITTLQKFPFVMRRPDAHRRRRRRLPRRARRLSRRSGGGSGCVRGWPSRRYAIIVDEAHSSQTGETAHQMKAVLGSRVQGRWPGATIRRTGRTG